MYALAASAAGVGVLALTQPSEAKIVYTPTHKNIVPKQDVSLNLNHDGKMDFNFLDSFSCTSFCEYIVGAITVIPARQANEIVGYVGRSRHYASALAAGVRVGPKSPFIPDNEVLEYGGYDAGTTSVGFCLGPWKNVRNRYLGLKFSANGKIHYGWARLNETCAKNGRNTAVLTGYAYETIPNKPVITGKTKGQDKIDDRVEEASPASLAVPTPKPATLGLLAAGASARSSCRRKDAVGATQ